MTNAGNENLRLNAIVTVNGHNIAYQIHPCAADIVQPADEGTDAVRTGFRRQERLRC